MLADMSSTCLPKPTPDRVPQFVGGERCDLAHARHRFLAERTRNLLLELVSDLCHDKPHVARSFTARTCGGRLDQNALKP